MSPITKAVTAAVLAAASLFLANNRALQELVIKGPDTGFSAQVVREEDGLTQFELTADKGEMLCEVGLEFAVEDSRNRNFDAWLHGGQRLWTGSQVLDDGAVWLDVTGPEGPADYIVWRSWRPIGVQYQDSDARITDWELWTQDDASDSWTKAWMRAVWKAAFLLVFSIAMSFTGVTAFTAARDKQRERAAERRAVEGRVSSSPGWIDAGLQTIVVEIVQRYDSNGLGPGQFRKFLMELAEDADRGLENLGHLDPIRKQHALLAAREAVEGYESRKVV